MTIEKMERTDDIQFFYNEAEKYNYPTIGHINGVGFKEGMFYVWIDDDAKRAEFLEFCLKHRGENTQIVENNRNDVIVTVIHTFKSRNKE